MKDTKKIFAENLKYYLDKSGQMQVQVADAIGVGKGTFSDWINGRSIGRMDKIEALAEYFRINVSDLLEERSEDNPYFLHKETEEMAQELYDNKELRLLFSASRKLSPEDVEAVRNIVERMTR